MDQEQDKCVDQRADLLLEMLIDWFEKAEVNEPEKKGRLLLAHTLCNKQHSGRENDTN